MTKPITQIAPNPPSSLGTRCLARAGFLLRWLWGVTVLTMASITVAGWFGRSVVVFDLFNAWMFQRAIVAAVLLVGCGVWLVRPRPETSRKKPLAIAAVAVVILAWHGLQIAPLWLGPSGHAAYAGATTPTDPSPTLSVAAYNRLDINPRWDDTINWINTSDAHLVVVQEANATLARRLDEAGSPFRVLVYAGAPHFGIGVAVRRELPAHIRIVAVNEYPTIDLGRPISRPPPPVVQVVIDYAGQPVHVITSHPPPALKPSRAYVHWVIIDTITRVVRDAVAAPGKPAVVVLGDLNSTPWSAGYRQIAAAGQLVDSAMGRGFVGTWYNRAGQWPNVTQIPIDHVLHTPDLRTISRRTFAPMGSDHEPVAATLIWKP